MVIMPISWRSALGARTTGRTVSGATGTTGRDGGRHCRRDRRRCGDGDRRGHPHAAAEHRELDSDDTGCRAGHSEGVSLAHDDVVADEAHPLTCGRSAVAVRGVRRRDGFGPVLDGVDLAVKNDTASLRAAVNGDTCAILLETVLGEGGVHELSEEFLREARRLADEFSALLILDEIQCGLGRTGEWFAFEQSGVRPDVLILGKPLGGGLPLSAFLVSGELFHVLGIGRHGSTLGGSPMACQLGLEFLSAVEDEGLLSRVLDTGAYLAQHLQALAAEGGVAVEARGRGLIQGLELNVPGRPIAEAALEQGMMLNFVQGNVMRFLPAFLLERHHVDSMLDVVRPLLKRAAEGHASLDTVLVAVA